MARAEPEERSPVEGPEAVMLIFLGESAALLRQLAEDLGCSEQEAAGKAVEALWHARSGQ